MLIVGILLAVITGTEWLVSGIVMGRAPKDNVDAGMVVEIVTVINTIVAIGMLCFFGMPNCATRSLVLVAVSIGLGGFFNYFQLVDMSKAMQCGPNGIIWSILQCGFIVPFLAGVSFFHVPLSPVRFSGLVALLVALNLMGFLGDKKKGMLTSNGPWKMLAFRSFMWTGLSQLGSNLPSYLNDIDDVGISWRMFWCYFGMALGMPVLAIFDKNAKKLFTLLGKEIAKKKCWFYASLDAFLGLIVHFLCCYPAMDILAKNNAGAIAYPVMVSSSIIAFDLYAMIFLHERRTLIQLLALLFCILGSIAICM